MLYCKQNYRTKNIKIYRTGIILGELDKSPCKLNDELWSNISKNKLKIEIGRDTNQRKIQFIDSIMDKKKRGVDRPIDTFVDTNFPYSKIFLYFFFHFPKLTMSFLFLFFFFKPKIPLHYNQHLIKQKPHAPPPSDLVFPFLTKSWKQRVLVLFLANVN